MSRQRSAWRDVVEPATDVTMPADVSDAPTRAQPPHTVNDLLSLGSVKFSP